MASGTRLVLGLLAAAAAVAILRSACVPVGSFRGGLDGLEWGMPADSVRTALGPPNRICVGGDVDHVDPPAGLDRPALGRATAERWIYSERPPQDDPPRGDGPDCRPEPAATELGFDTGGRLRWIVRESLQTPAEADPALGR